MFTELEWVANYIDGTKLRRFRPEGGENKYADIDVDKLERFDLVNTQTKKVVYALYLREGQKLIYRRRTFRRMDGSPDVVVYLVGYNMTIMTNAGPKAIIVINYIHPDGSIALDGPRNNLKLLAFEE